VIIEGKIRLIISKLDAILILIRIKRKLYVFMTSLESECKSRLRLLQRACAFTFIIFLLTLSFRTFADSKPFVNPLPPAVYYSEITQNYPYERKTSANFGGSSIGAAHTFISPLHSEENSILQPPYVQAKVNYTHNQPAVFTGAPYYQYTWPVSATAIATMQYYISPVEDPMLPDLSNDAVLVIGKVKAFISNSNPDLYNETHTYAFLSITQDLRNLAGFRLATEGYGEINKGLAKDQEEISFLMAEGSVAMVTIQVFASTAPRPVGYQEHETHSEAFVDPIFTIAPSFLLTHPGYSIMVSPGVYNGVSTIPEPETYAMLLAGLGVIGLIARRRKQTS
jgi:hypothetical protein